MYTILSNFMHKNVFPLAVEELTTLDYKRYDNLFERKSFVSLGSHTILPMYLGNCLNELTSIPTLTWVSRLTGLPVTHADYGHYGGIFKYEKGDYLRAHVDAGIHPYNGQRKVATALLYFTEAQFDMCDGDNCLANDPLVDRKIHMYLHPNECVIFSNHDYAWHAVPLVTDGGRYVMTVSYMAPREFDHSEYKNPRTRALFARTTWDNDFDAALAEQRSSEQDHEKVWRTDD